MNILLFGSSGMLGKYIYLFLCNKFNVIRSTRKDFNIIEKNWSHLEKKIKDIDVIINCAGMIPQRKNTNTREYIIVNTLFPIKLSELCFLKNKKFIHITTDCVFNGNKGDYTELDTHDSDNIYGITKSQGEPDNCCVIRTSIIGEELYNKKSLVEWLKSNKGKEINGYENHIWNGVTCLELSKIIENIIQNNIYWFGVRHIFSEKITKYRLSLMISDIYNLDLKVKKFHTPDSKNMSLCSIKPRLFKIKNLEDQIKELKEFDILQ